MAITINGSGTITGASTLATTVVSPTLTTPNIDSAQFATVSGTAPIYPCRAWVSFNGTGTVAINASGNVSSITDNGVGDYTVNYTTALAASSCVTTTTGGTNDSGQNDCIGSVYLASTTTARVRFYDVSAAALVDVAGISVMAIR